MNIHYITYGTNAYVPILEKARLNPTTDNFIKHMMNDSDISDDFKKEHDYILSNKKGAGYWLWKPYIIKKVMDEVDYGDVLLYVDCGDLIHSPMDEYIKSKIENFDLLFFQGYHLHRIWCKRKCFELMDCLGEKYLNAFQLEAGVLIFKKCDASIDFLEKWLKLCTIPEIITDDGIGDEIAGFRDHRWDQAVLTNLVLKMNLPVQPISELGPYINFNEYIP